MLIDDMADEVYAVKRTEFLGKPVTYICQNINGPCPLLAISNVLLLRGHLQLDAVLGDAGVIAAPALLDLVRQRLRAANPPLANADELARLTQEKTLADVEALLPSLLVGLDVNVRFRSTTDFEYTVGCAVFDMLDMALVHGWLLDEQDEKTLHVVQNKSYNELIERVVDYRGVLATESAKPSETTQSDDDAGVQLATSAIASLQIDVAAPASSSEPPRSPSKNTVETLKKERQLSDADATDTATTLLTDGPVLEEFFASTASQLTYFGLVKLHEDLRERQLCVFFRNNHFSTLFKYEGALYLLVTDAGYLDEPMVVWERLNEIDGDSEYLDSNFRTLNASDTRQQSIFQQEDARRRQCDELSSDREGPSAADVTPTPPSPRAATALNRQNEQDDPDFLLALRLQQEEEEAHARAQSQHRSPRLDTVTNRFTVNEHASGEEMVESRTPSQGPSGSENEEYSINAQGELMLSEAELQAQREAALYYQQQKQQQTHLQHGRSSGPPSPDHRQSNDCCVM